jgi:predicted signal transduction protein with EAL and GGDEF domain
MTIIFVGFIWYYYQPEFITTKIGIILTALSMIIFLVPYNRQFSLLSGNKTEPNSKEYLQKLIKLKEKQLFQQTTMLSVYFLMLSLGIGLYMIEYASKMTIT